MNLEFLFRSLDHAVSWPIDLDGRIESMELRAKRFIKAVNLLKLIRTSWRDQHDPGKGRPYVFFVSDYQVHADERNPTQYLHIDWCMSFFPRCLVDDLKEAELGATHWAEESKRYPVPLGGMSEAKREHCKACGKEAYIIGQHWQSCDSPDGDTWNILLMRLCPHCLKIDQFAENMSAYRMTHLLK